MAFPDNFTVVYISDQIKTCQKKKKSAKKRDNKCKQLVISRFPHSAAYTE